MIASDWMRCAKTDKEAAERIEKVERDLARYLEATFTDSDWVQTYSDSVAIAAVRFIKLSLYKPSAEEK